MKLKPNLNIALIFLLLGVWVFGTAPKTMAQDVLKYSCSKQVYDAFEKEKIAAFTAATGVQVDVKVASSGSCAYRLKIGNCDIASTARKLYRRDQSYGFKEIAFCKDPIAVIARKECNVSSVTEEQLQDIFAGDITNWKEVGGADLPIKIIVPGEDTAAHKNFRRQVMKHKDIAYDFMTYNSTMVIETIKYFPCGAVSFISQGAALHHKEIGTIKINGLAPSDKDYPYFQRFYYIAQDELAGNLKKFVDYTFSDGGKRLIRKYGMIPISK
jgi:phosphate transport system substrate-binding protein